MRLLRSVLVLATMTMASMTTATTAHAEGASKTDPEGFGKHTLELFEAMKAQNTTALDAMLAPHFLFTSFAGMTGNKAEYLDVFAKKLMKIDSYKLDPVAVQVYGDAAVVVYRFSMTAQTGGGSWPDELVSTDTWVKQKGKWVLAARHSSRVMKMPPQQQQQQQH